MFFERFRYPTIMLAVHCLAAGCSSEAPAPAPAENQASAPGPAAEAEPQGDGKLVLAFGDSLYAGYGLAPDESFPAQLQKALRGRGVAVTVHHAGVSGDTGAAGLERLQFTLGGLPRKPDLAIVGLGGNDMLRGLDPAATERNLLSICRQLRDTGADVVLTGMLAAPNLGQDYGARFNGLFPRVADQCGATLYPFFLEDVVTEPSLMLGDRIHPSSAGIRRIVGRIEPMIARELEQAEKGS